MIEQAQRDDDLISVLIRDHRAVEGAFQEYEDESLSYPQRRDLIDHVVAELVRHSVAEEQYLYPAAREVLPEGDELADHEIREHAEAEKVMKRIERLDPEKPDFDHAARQLIADIRHHVSDEENDLLPRLQQACTANQLQDLGNKILMAKKSAPTRPHPGAPDTPPANLILDPGVGMVDRLRDALSGRQH